jgi:hypothetical protein
MARAAAKRRPPVRHHEADRRRHKDSSGQRFEDTLFFNRIRKQAKWVFVLLTLAFAGGFVLFGVGSSNLGGLSDIFSGIGGGSSGPSVSKPLKATQKNPKDAAAWRDLADAYDVRGDYQSAIAAWTTYTTLRPKNVDGLTHLATDYEQQFQSQTQAAQAAQIDAQSAQTTNFGPPPNSPLGKAYAGIADPIGQAISNAANQRFNQALNDRQQTATQLIGVYRQLAGLEPAEATWQFQLAQAAQNAGDLATAVAAYRKYVKLVPDDANAAYARQQIKTLSAQLKQSSSAPQG